jgi:hypothetical protein
MVFLDKLSDLWSNRRSIEADDEHLALSRGLSLANPIAGCLGKKSDPPSLCNRSNVSRTFGHIAHSVDKEPELLTCRDHPTRDRSSRSSP